MKILILHQDIPFPANSGYRMRTNAFIQALYPEAELGILCFDKNLDPQSRILADKYFKHVWLVTPQRRQTAGLRERISNFCGGIPWEISNTFSKSFEDAFLDVIKTEHFDVIFIRYLFLSQYVIKHANKIKAKVIVDLDDIDFIKAKRDMENEVNISGYHTLRKKLNNYLLERYHKRLNRCDIVTVASQKDCDYLKERRLLGNIRTITNAIDVDSYQEVKALNEQTLRAKTLLFCGNLSYEANCDGLSWFMRDVFPVIRAQEPEVKFHIAGLKPKSEILKYADGCSVFVFPDVADIRACYEGSSCVVVPLRIGSGTRIKILEAFACKRPVVTTAVGAEGLGVGDNQECIIRDSPEEFAAACLRILKEDSLTHRLVDNGYRFVKERFDAKKVTGTIKELFNHV